MGQSEPDRQAVTVSTHTRRIVRSPVRALLVVALLVATTAGANAFDKEDLDKLHETGDCPKCDLSDANLRGADLSGAILLNADLSGAYLVEADLRNAFLLSADLEGAELNGADLSGAALFHTELAGANLEGATLTDTLYEPVSAPRPETMWNVKGLASLKWKTSAHGLNLLREVFKGAGMRQQERDVTYAIKHWDRRNRGGAEGALNYVLFELTSDYGMSPGRPLLLALALLALCAVAYAQAVFVPEPKGYGIWRVWPNPDDRIEDQTEKKTPERVEVTSYHVALWGLYFGVLSAFHIGWRDLNVGNWIARINPREYTLRATGWVKVVSGVQSLVSVYLIALAALTYFGRPFE